MIDQFPEGNALVADQLRRAALSVPLNIAEAAGKPSPADNARHFAIARGSALECEAILDACEILHIRDPNDISSDKELLISIVAMLSKLCRSPRPKSSKPEQDHHQDQA